MQTRAVSLTPNLISRIDEATFFSQQTNYGQVVASENNARVFRAST